MNHYPWMLPALLSMIASGAAAKDIDTCALVTAAEYAAIVGGKLDGPPTGSGSACGPSFDRYQRIAQVQVVDGFGESSRYEGLLKFWQEENARERKSGNKVEELTVGDAFCEAKVPAFMSPQTRCMKELPGKRVLYATVSAPRGSGKAPPAEVVVKLLNTAAARVK